MAVNKCIKYLLFIFNLLFWLSGCIILGVSIYLKVNKDGNRITSQSLPGVDLLIAVGVIVMLLGFLGCCGAIKENRCMLILFFASLLLVFILLLAAGIVGAVAENKVKEWVKERLQKFMPLSAHPEIREDLERLQRELGCCGLVNGASDWDVIPDSCRCSASDPQCGPDKVYAAPCSARIVRLLEKNMEVVIGIAFAIAVLLIAGMVFSMILYCQITKRDGATAA
ncbi:tetraspanin-8-like [Hippocampus zosterae]|uniref:tetraspanin-8-like n=1 Tax=Hippocampus zosterae TaxID=109293 RepID=UPI00223D1545|nr:tetraspanin-8-like [Hippocampus zosterae]XP_051911085.1 tetraspanin-8-like [Hippocampus zosterae]